MRSRGCADMPGIRFHSEDYVTFLGRNDGLDLNGHVIYGATEHKASILSGLSSRTSNLASGARGITETPAAGLRAGPKEQSVGCTGPIVTGFHCHVSQLRRDPLEGVRDVPSRNDGSLARCCFVHLTGVTAGLALDKWACELEALVVTIACCLLLWNCMTGVRIRYCGA